MGAGRGAKGKAYLVRETVGYYIVEESAASDALDEASLTWPKALAAWEAVTWAIMKNPECGFALNEAGTVRSVQYHGSVEQQEPDITILYEIRPPDLIVVRNARFVSAAAHKAGSA